MIKTKYNSNKAELLAEGQGSSISGRAITSTLFVSPDGDGTDGSSWSHAYTTIQSALDVASTDTNECTLVMIAPHPTYYDINTTGDPTWSANLEIRGTHRIWAPIRNTHDSATSIFNFTGKASIQDLALFQTAAINGVSFSANGWRVRNCGFNSELITGAAISVHIDGSASQTRGGIMENAQFQGHVSRTTAMHIEDSKVNEIGFINVHNALVGMHITGTSDDNIIWESDFGSCALAFDLDGGDGQHFNSLNLHSNTRNFDDEVKNHTYNDIKGATPVYIYPDNFTGVNVPSHADAGEWGTLTAVVAANAIDNPFRIVAAVFDPTINQWTRVRITGTGAAPYTNEYMFDANKRAGNSAASGTDFIYNTDAEISAQTKVVGAGPDNLAVWFKIQEI